MEELDVYSDESLGWHHSQTGVPCVNENVRLFDVVLVIGIEGGGVSHVFLVAFLCSMHQGMLFALFSVSLAWWLTTKAPPSSDS